MTHKLRIKKKKIIIIIKSLEYANLKSLLFSEPKVAPQSGQTVSFDKGIIVSSNYLEATLCLKKLR